MIFFPFGQFSKDPKHNRRQQMKKTISTSRSIRMVPLLFVILFAGATLANSEPCPPKDDSLPCVCHGDSDITDVVCSNITSEDHLKRILWKKPFGEVLPHLVLHNLSFSTLPSLSRFNLRTRNLEILDGNISDFARFAFWYQPLLSLRVDRNRVADVPMVALNLVSEYLRILSMSGNALTKLGNRSLSYLKRVERLTLSGNKISEVARDSLPPNVQSLWISRNHLTTFNGALQSLYRLRHLDASHNRLKSTNGEFVGLHHLQTVILDHNKISNISGTISHPDSLRKLSLAGNGIREVGEAFADFKQLTHLNLAHNGMTKLSRTAFENLINLYDLNLSENPLTTFQFCPSLIPLRSLRRIKIYNSNMSTIPSDCFESNTNLELVDLSRNQLSSLQLTYATNLVTLDISSNNFQFVDHLDLKWDGSATLILEDNPWLCSKETTSGLNDLDERGYYFPSGYPTCFKTGVKPLGCWMYNT